MKNYLLILVLAVMCSSVARAGVLKEFEARLAYEEGDYATPKNMT
jgi:hypothetical protein